MMTKGPELACGWKVGVLLHVLVEVSGMCANINDRILDALCEFELYNVNVFWHATVKEKNAWRQSVCNSRSCRQ